MGGRMTITTQVTWQDLQSSLDSELTELREAHGEIRELAIEEYDEDALDRVLPNDPDLLDEEDKDLYVYQQQLEQYNQTAGVIQNRKNLLDKLQEEYGSGPFEIKLLSGEETMEIEQELRMLAQGDGVEMSSVQIKRNALTVDKAVVDAPGGDFPTDEDGSPKPSKCPNGLTLALWEQVERYNNAGDVDFRAGGFEDEQGGLSVAPSTTDSPSDVSGAIDGTLE